MTSLPTWAFWALSFGSPTLTAIIAFWSQRSIRRANKEIEARSRREEVMRMLRWAAELAVSEDTAKSRLGIQELKALRGSDLLTPADEEFIDAALRAAITTPRNEITEMIQSAGRPEVVVMTGTEVTGGGVVQSKAGDEPKGGGSS